MEPGRVSLRFSSLRNNPSMTITLTDLLLAGILVCQIILVLHFT